MSQERKKSQLNLFGYNNTEAPADEFAFVGHGQIHRHNFFFVPPDCFIITYCPENYILTNSAIYLISELRAQRHFKTLADIEAFAQVANDELTHGAARVYKPGEKISSHLLHQLESRSVIGTEEHKKQFIDAMKTLESCKIQAQDASSLIGKSGIEVDENHSIALENAVRLRMERANSQGRLTIIHWLACRVDVQKKQVSGFTRCPALSQAMRITPIK